MDLVNPCSNMVGMGRNRSDYGRNRSERVGIGRNASDYSRNGSELVNPGRNMVGIGHNIVGILSEWVGTFWTASEYGWNLSDRVGLWSESVGTCRIFFSPSSQSFPYMNLHFFSKCLDLSIILIPLLPYYTTFL